ncbi:hypothetical protein RIF29_16605 [Crotalaria pallida]|uniref:RING-type E3 ubiquitin transferase n=1 Tax=Crotalaria pallida TaxID=3830 RepID=A0AAN9IJY7_CROPI
MVTILIFLTTMMIAIVAHTFHKHLIQTFHKVLFKHKKENNEETESEFCAVCLSEFCKGEKVKSLPVCNHRYHADCIDAWLKNHITCPLCRNKIIDHVPNNNQQKHLKEFLFHVLQSCSDRLVVLIYMVLPACISETFPLVH